LGARRENAAEMFSSLGEYEIKDTGFVNSVTDEVTPMNSGEDRVRRKEDSGQLVAGRRLRCYICSKTRGGGGPGMDLSWKLLGEKPWPNPSAGGTIRLLYRLKL